MNVNSLKTLEFDRIRALLLQRAGSPEGAARIEALAGAKREGTVVEIYPFISRALDQNRTARVKIELGRTQMYLEDVLKLRRGSVVTLDKLAGDPVDIFVNGRLVAKGEVLVLNDNFCVRVAELFAGVSSG